MAAWFEKKEKRRFRRIEMPVKFFVTPSDPIVDREIFALGIDYFPKSVQTRIARNHKQLLHWIGHIQEQKEILEPVFHEVVEAAKLLGDCVKQVSQGKNPMEDEVLAEQVMNNLKMVGKISSLEEPAPRTYNYFSELEKKLTHFFRLMLLSLHKSSAKNYHSFTPSGHVFKIDEMTQKFTQESFQKIPLVQSIYYMNALVEDYCAVFQEMNQDYYLREHPEVWSVQRLNISAGGFAQFYNKRFLPGKPLTSYVYLKNHGRVMRVKTTVARLETNMKQLVELNAFNFEFPDPQDQRFLETEIDRIQVDRAMEQYFASQSISNYG